MVGGLLLSQALTLYTTPVIYIFFDNLAQRFAHKSKQPETGGAEQARAGMNISAPFIRRPVATTLLTVAVALAGAIGFEVLPVAPLPEVDFPTISVSAGLPGASADIMASSVATPLERQFGHIAGVTEMTSASSLGSHFDHHTVRPQPRHRRRGARCGGRHQRRADLPARQPPIESELPQGESRRFADYDSWPNLG